MKLNRTNKKITSLIFLILMITSVFTGLLTPVMTVEPTVDIAYNESETTYNVTIFALLEQDTNTNNLTTNSLVIFYDMTENADGHFFTAINNTYNNTDIYMTDSDIKKNRSSANVTANFSDLILNNSISFDNSSFDFYENVTAPQVSYDYMAFTPTTIKILYNNEVQNNTYNNADIDMTASDMKIDRYSANVTTNASDIILNNSLFLDNFSFDFENVTALQVPQDNTIAIPNTIRILYNNEVRVLDLESYLKGVVQSETHPGFMKIILLKCGNWPENEQYKRELTDKEVQELLKAQAVAARSYAVAIINGMWSTGKQHGVHVVTDERDQVWRPAPAEGYDQRVIDAVEATLNQVITHPGGAGVYGGVVGAFYYSYGNLENLPFGTTLTPTQAGWPGDLPYLQPVDSYGPLTAVGTYTIGHGVGMSQWGAAHLAALGFTYIQILEHYFTGISIANTGQTTLKGDINGDRVVDMADSIHLWNHIGKVPGFELIHVNGDINGDRVVDMADSIHLWNHIGKIPGFEVIH